MVVNWFDDASCPGDVQRLTDGEAADLVFTDPPYNVDYEGYTEDHLKIQGDRMSGEQFQQFLLATFTWPKFQGIPEAQLLRLR